MFSSRFSRLSLTLIAGILCLTALGCSRSIKPKVVDNDTYQVITLGRASYITPHGVRVVSTEPGLVRHTASFLPGTAIVVSHYDNPPLDLRIDAEEQQREFLRELPEGQLSSVQYQKRGDMDIVKVYAKGLTVENNPVFGTMSVIRQHGETVVMKLVGPGDYSQDITHLNERLCRAFAVDPPAPKKNAGPKPESDYDQEKQEQSKGS